MRTKFCLLVLTIISVAAPIEIRKIEFPKEIGSIIYEEWCNPSPDGKWCTAWKKYETRRKTLVLWEMGKTQTYPIYVSDIDTTQFYDPTCNWAGNEKSICEGYRWGKKDSLGNPIPDSSYHFIIEFKDLLNKIEAGAKVFEIKNEKDVINSLAARQGHDVRVYTVSGKLVKHKLIGSLNENAVKEFLFELEQGSYVISISDAAGYKVQLVYR